MQTLAHLIHNPNGTWLLACNGSTMGPNHGFHCSGDPRAVTCPVCKKTEVFKQTMDKLPNGGR